MKRPTTSRRTFALGAAWAVPTVVAGAAAPAMASSTSTSTPQLGYVWQVVTNTHDSGNPGTSYCTAPQTTLSNIGSSGNITIDKVAAYNQVLGSYTFGPIAIGASLAPGAGIPLGGDGSGTLDPNQNYYLIVKWTDASGVSHTTTTCAIQSQHAACGQPAMKTTGTDLTGCTLPSGVSYPAGW